MLKTKVMIIMSKISMPTKQQLRRSHALRPSRVGSNQGKRRRRPALLSRWYCNDPSPRRFPLTEGLVKFRRC
jgi:hypothetical protein